VSLRVARLTGELLSEAKQGRINVIQIDVERRKALDRLRYWTPPLIDLKRPNQEWYEATPPGLEMTTADLLSCFQSSVCVGHRYLVSYLLGPRILPYYAIFLKPQFTIDTDAELG
jgi:hypothetical protein